MHITFPSAGPLIRSLRLALRAPLAPTTTPPQFEALLRRLSEACVEPGRPHGPLAPERDLPATK